MTRNEVKIETLPLLRRAGFCGRHIVSCGTPARKPGDALVTGNGKLLLSATGNPACDRLVLSCEELAIPQWAEAPQAPLIAGKLTEIRTLMINGKFVEAAKLAMTTALENGTPDTLSGNPHHPAIVLQLSQPIVEAKDYIFTLNLRNSLIVTHWVDRDGEFRREMFASRADGIAAVRVSAPPGKLRLSLKGEFPLQHFTRERIVSSNNVPGGVDRLVTSQPIPPEVVVRHAREGILLTGRYAYHQGGFTTVVRAVSRGGELRVDEDGLHIEAGESLVFLLSARRNYSSQPPEDDEELLNELQSFGGDFDALLARHETIHTPLFDRVSADLGGDPADYLLTGSELKQKQFLSQSIIPAYAEMMIDRGRFFLLNECGKFPPIYGHVNVNINHQISGGNIGNLTELMESFFRWIEWQLPDARENARRILGTRGFLIATHPDEESGRLYHFNEYYPHHYWISSSGWCLQPFLEYYQCTADADFLRGRLIPLYKELFLLYEDFLTVRDENGKFMFIPSYSPENFPANIPCMTVINAVMDISVCREVLETLLEYAPIAGLATQEEMARWQSKLDDLPPYLVGDHGELKEWAWRDLEDNYDHRHSSHLYGAFPGHEFQPEMNPGLYQAATIANRMRVFGNESFHGIGHRAQAAARLKDSWLLEGMLRLTLESGYVNDNFTTTHNPYQPHAMPDAQGALPTILIESMLYSRPGFIEVLPALPKGSFRKGSLKGVLARSFVTVDELAWDTEKGQIRLTLTSKIDQTVTFCCRLQFDRFSCEHSACIIGESGIYRRVKLVAGERAVLNWEGVVQP